MRKRKGSSDAILDASGRQPGAPRGTLELILNVMETMTGLTIARGHPQLACGERTYLRRKGLHPCLHDQPGEARSVPCAAAGEHDRRHPDRGAAVHLGQ